MTQQELAEPTPPPDRLPAPSSMSHTKRQEYATWLAQRVAALDATVARYDKLLAKPYPAAPWKPVYAASVQQTRDFTAAKAHLLRQYLETLQAYDQGTIY